MPELQEIHDVVVGEICRLLEEEGKSVPQLRDEDGLIELGVDSLGFAVLITRLDESLGYDPFDLIERGGFPRTVGELAEAYVESKPAGRSTPPTQVDSVSSVELQ